MPYWCSDCRSYFSVRTGTAIARSNVSLRKWAVAIYLCTSYPKSVSALQLRKSLGVTHKTAWFMMHRLREAWVQECKDPMEGPIEVDETYVGGLRKNMHGWKRRQFKGRGSAGKTPVVGAKDRATGKVAARVVPVGDAAC